MTVCGKHGKTIKLFSHPSHKPWKSLRDSHILRPAADNLYPLSKPKRSLPQLPNPLTFRLIFQLEKTEGPSDTVRVIRLARVHPYLDCVSSLEMSDIWRQAHRACS